MSCRARFIVPSPSGKICDFREPIPLLPRLYLCLARRLAGEPEENMVGFSNPLNIANLGWQPGMREQFALGQPEQRR